MFYSLSQEPLNKFNEVSADKGSVLYHATSEYLKKKHSRQQRRLMAMGDAKVDDACSDPRTHFGMGSKVFPIAEQTLRARMDSQREQLGVGKRGGITGLANMSFREIDLVVGKSNRTLNFEDMCRIAQWGVQNT